MMHQQFTRITDLAKQGVSRVLGGIEGHLNDDTRAQILGANLSPLYRSGTGKTLITLAMWADLLRVVNDALFADGIASDEEIHGSQKFLKLVAEAFAKVRPEYSDFAQLPTSQIPEFLKCYQSDKNLFGYRSEQTKWAGVGVCKNIAQQFGEVGPLEDFGALVMEISKAVVAVDGISDEEQEFLKDLEQLFAVDDQDASDHRQVALVASIGRHHEVVKKCSRWKPPPRRTPIANQNRLMQPPQEEDRATRTGRNHLSVNTSSSRRPLPEH